MIELIKFCHGKKGLYIGLVKISPWLLLMKLGVINIQKGKEKMLSFFFGGMNESNFNSQCEDFSEKIIPKIIRPDALFQIKKHLSNNEVVVVVSASAGNWVSPWCRNNNISCICTKLNVQNNTITGKINGNNCTGNEKVNRIRQAINLDLYSRIFCYGDTKGDMPMLKLATDPFYKEFTG